MLRHIINILLFIAFLFGYLEWGSGHSAFIAQVEWEVFTSGDKFLENITHPVIFPGLIGQAVLLYCVFAKHPKKGINVSGVTLLLLIMLLLFFIGIISKNYRMIFFASPYILLSIFFFVKLRSIFGYRTA